LIYAFKASRCFRKELSRVILAFSARIACVFVGSCFGCCAFVTLRTIGVIGVAMMEARAKGCVLIGPMIGLFRGMADNSFLPNSFKKQIPPAEGFARGDSEQ
jgi:hypothetical protein